MSLAALGHTWAVVFAGQALAAAIFVPLQTEKFYDLCGSLGFITATLTALATTPSLSRYATQDSLASRGAAAGTVKVFASAAANVASRLRDVVGGKTSGSVSATSGSMAALSKAESWRSSIIYGHHPRQLVAAVLVLLWAVRLGSFLFIRILKSGRDPRFDSIKRRPMAFLGAWTLQALWVGITASPVYMLNAIPPSLHAPLNTLDALALGVWLAGMALEATADREKSYWRKARDSGKHRQKFIHTGVWSWCRHPNYFGEIMLWTGQALLALPTLAAATSGRAVLGSWALPLAVAAPALEYALIRYISGVPMLEEAMNKKMKSDKTYAAYKRKTPCFVPFVGSTD